ncbi:Mu transposase C-terminal domain-containing protein [Streptomyces sp. NPDC048550]|uniref:Mu transposase C-terminal domain-containing protein n=1 Tax=Streptomyces sp. NPDC048550 TaxID=3155739 RepID=UPI0034419F92
MLEDDGRVRKLIRHGVRWRSRDYVGAWIAGQASRSVRIRHRPHHDHEIEVCDPAAATSAPPTSPTLPPPATRCPAPRPHCTGPPTA